MTEKNERLICLDANVWVAWLTAEAKTPRVRDLMKEWKTRYEAFVAPTFMLYEVMSTMRKKLKHGGIPVSSIKDGLNRFYRLPILLYQTKRLLQLSFDWAERLNETVIYDVSYLALAAWKKVPYWTADEKFHRVARKHYADSHLV